MSETTQAENELTETLQTENELIPATILTGFLGAGKTTLLNRILTEPHGMKIAVIENEYGETSIDSELLVQAEEQVVMMNNGCLCCTVRGDLLNILTDLADKKASGELDFDRIVIETTGLADPTPIAQTFFLEEGICSRYRLDGVVTLVDAKHGHKQLDDNKEAQAQVGFADRIFLTKLDLVPPETEASLRARLSSINARAPIERADFGKADIRHVLEVNGFNLDGALELSPDFLGKSEHHHDDHDEHHHHHDHDCSEYGCDCHHKYAEVHHDDEVSSFVLRSSKPMDMDRFDQFLTDLIERYADDLMRYKGIVNFEGYDIRYVFQGVHDVAGCSEGKPWGSDPRETVVVFIGRNLPKDIIEQEFNRTLVQ